MLLPEIVPVDDIRVEDCVCPLFLLLLTLQVFQ
jgi:hypothetical protein